MNGGKQIPLSDYQYDLPDAYIAFHPPAERGSSKLLVYRGGDILHQAFQNLPNLLPENSLLIFNESRVIPARIKTMTSKGKPVELFLLKPAGSFPDPVIALNATGFSVWECMVGRRKDWKEGEAIYFYPGEIELQATWENRDANHVRFSWTPAHIPFAQILEAVGKIPLPPYISRDVSDSDKQTYQTVYSKTEGSVAAPTAGLHFTDDVLARIRANGHQTDFVTLHVGAGTFMPVKSDDMLQHAMHTELLSVRFETIEKLANHSGALVPVGTTSLRVLESLWHLGAADGLPNTVAQFPDTSEKDFSMRQSMQRLADKMKANGWQSISAQTAIMIFPGYKIHACDALVTNFHQPGSTLLMLVSALVGENWKNIYQMAKENDYHFLSYGDSSLLFARK